MSFREKVQKIVIEMDEGKKLHEITETIMRNILEEFKKPDGYFDAAWQKVLELNKEKIIKASVYEILRDMPKKDKELLLGGVKDESNKVVNR
jgi:hypothetical protein